MKCDKCKKEFSIGNGADGLPNGVGFELDDGRIIVLCKECLKELGRLKEAGNEAGTKAFFKELGVV